MIIKTLISLLGVAGSVCRYILLVRIHSALTSPGNILRRILFQLLTSLSLLTISSPGDAVGGDSAARLLIFTTLQQETSLDTSEVEEGEVSALLIVHAEFSALHSILHPSVLNLLQKIKSSWITIMINVGAVDVVRNLDKRLIYLKIQNFERFLQLENNHFFQDKSYLGIYC